MSPEPAVPSPDARTDDRRDDDASNEKVIPASALVVGFARTGVATASALRRRGAEVVVIDDRPSEQLESTAVALGCWFDGSPAPAELARLAREAEVVVVSPGVPPSHPVFGVEGASIISEVELAYRLGDTPIVGVTGTNGKTSVTLLVAQLLGASGISARAVGNIGTPLVEAIDDGLELLVCELSSFQLAYTSTFRPVVGTWLNFAPDHLDWHPNLESYALAKARIFAAQTPDDVAIANHDDAVVMSFARASHARLVTFAPDAGEYRVTADAFVTPDGSVIARLSDLARHLPHDIANALAACATAIESGGRPESFPDVLSHFVVPPHRVERIASIDGVEFYDDSKATTPSAVIAALSGFTRAVLIAGGRNKGLDLSAIGAFVDGEERLQLRGVVAIGEAAAEVKTAFPGHVVAPARSMDEAVELAAKLARPGDAVLLSPGCASFDWYRSYEERGEDFVRAVKDYREARDAALEAYPGRFGH